LSIADKSLEYVFYKGQLPLLGAAGLWFVIGAGLGLFAFLAIVILSAWYLFWCLVFTVGLACTKCFYGSHEWWSENLGAAREGLREAWKLPGEPEPEREPEAEPEAEREPEAEPEAEAEPEPEPEREPLTAAASF
jgi:hypothetical protein